MTADDFVRANAGVGDLLDEFIKFLRGGGFAFAWDD